MKWFQQLKIRQKLGLLVIVFSTAVLVVGGIGYYNLKQSTNYLDRIYNENLLQSKLAYENRIFIRRIRSDLFEVMLTNNQAEHEKILKEIEETRKSYNENLELMHAMNLSPDQKKQLQELDQILPKYKEMNNQAIGLVKEGKNTEAHLVYKQQVEALATQTTQILRGMSAIAEKEAAAMKNQAASDLEQMRQLFLLLVVAIIFIGSGLGVLIIRQITGRLSDSVRFLEKIASGDFSENMKDTEVQDSTEFGALAKVMDHMNRNIRNLIQKLITTSAQLTAASQQLAASADQSAQASVQMAESVSKVASGAGRQLEIAVATNQIVEEMAKGVHQVTQNTLNVASSAGMTAEAALSGNQAISKTIEQMKMIEQATENTADVVDELETKSELIDRMVKLISNIAEQTNLLALNAAIEAARAGTAGKGFAVVADEVRKLAEQSALATKDITHHIGEIQAKTKAAVTFMKESKREVESGADLVNIAGRNFNDILQMIQGISGEIQDISAAAEELTAGTEDVVRSSQTVKEENEKTARETENISEATEEQLGSMEEIAIASMHLSKLAEELDASIQKFKV